MSVDLIKTVCEANKCNGCMACLQICPKKCIKITDNIGSLNAIIDKKICIDCHLCEKVCPNINEVSKQKPVVWYQGWTENKSIRDNSSSGGIASSIINYFISTGGYVASCLFKNGDFIFELTNDLNIAKQFAGSKYVKSNPKGIYDKIQNRLKTDKVLFVGLPCQVAGVKNYIKNQENLYTIDLICHGTPSIKLFKHYVLEQNKKVQDIHDVKFRDKVYKGLSFDGKNLYPKRVMDEYICAFEYAINFTENCYHCRFASVDRISDITLGDSWGTKYKNEEKKGVSLILVQSKKGQKLLDSISLTLKEVDLDTAIENNPQLRRPTLLTSRREKFLNLIKKEKSFKLITWIVLPKVILKQKIKYLLFKLHLIK